MTIVVLAEKPSVARDIALVLGAHERRRGWLEGNGYQVTWAVGHLVSLAQPHEIREEWRRWDPALLPMLPEHFPLVARERVSDQLRVVDRLFNHRDVRQIVCATDAGREGELIFRMIYEAVHCTKPALRLWISSLTPDAIRDGFRQLRPSSAYNALAAAARVRSEADWLVGMNLSRAYSLATGETLSIGRVKTPTLAMVVARELAVTKFVAEPYRQVEATFVTDGGSFNATYVHRASNAKGQPVFSARLPATTDDPSLKAESIVARAHAGTATLSHVEEEKTATPPPLLFDLTELQRAANRLWGWTATHTLQVAQELYERHKVLSYPRTDSRHLSQAVAETLPAVVRGMRAPYEAWLAPETGRARLLRRFVDDAKVSDHHAIIPTATPANLAEGSDGAKLYDLVCRRLLSAWQPDAIDATTKVDVTFVSPGMEDRYQARGKVTVRAGWRSIDLTTQHATDKETRLPSGLRVGIPAALQEARIVDKQTRPPDFFTEATLLSAMESAGASLDGELSAAMKDRGLGTPSTRAAMIEELVARAYMSRQGKSLRATALGVKLVQRVHRHVASPAMTGEWEAKLRRIERGQDSADALLGEVRRFVETTTCDALAGGIAPRTTRPAQSAPSSLRSPRRAHAHVR